MLCCRVLSAHSHKSAHCQQKQATNGGIGWLDEGLAKYEEISNLMESEHQLQGDTFNQELLKVHHKGHHQKMRKRQNRMLTTSGQKSKSLTTVYEGARSFERGPAIMQL